MKIDRRVVWLWSHWTSLTVLAFTVSAPFHLIYFGLWRPYRAIRSGDWPARLQQFPDRSRYFTGTIYSLYFAGFLSVIVANACEVPILVAQWPSLRAWACGVAVCLIMVACERWHCRRGVERGDAYAYFAMPSDRLERRLWAVLSLTAGVTEEITWRGVQIVLLTTLLGSPVAAALIVAATFASGHLFQGWRWVIVVAAFSLMLQGLVWVSGSLYVAMAVHVAVDLYAGLLTGRLGRERRYRTPSPAPSSMSSIQGAMLREG